MKNNVEKMNLEKIIKWLRNADITKFSDDDLFSLSELLAEFPESSDILEILERIRNELVRRKDLVKEIDSALQKSSKSNHGNSKKKSTM